MMGRGKPKALALGVFALGLLVACLAGLGLEQRNQAEAQQRLAEDSQRSMNTLIARFKQYQHGLQGARGIVASNVDGLDRGTFQRYSDSRNYDVEFPGTRGIGVIRRVAPGDEAAFVARERQGGWPDFEVRQLAPYAGERYVIQYIEPVARNLPAVGLDIASEVNRRTAAQAAMRSGEATVTGLITLVQATGNPLQAFLMLLPVYRPGMPLRDASEREKAAVGWTYSPLVIDEVLAGLDVAQGKIALKLSDVEGATSTAFYVSPNAAVGGENGLSETLEIQVFGRQWRAEARPTQAFYAALKQRSGIGLAAGLAALSALFSLLVFAIANGRSKEREAYLAQAHRAAVVASSLDAIIVFDMAGEVVDWNHSAERMFGYTAQEAMGESLTSLLLPPERCAEGLHAISETLRGHSSAPFDSTRMHKDGSLVEVSIALAVLKDSKNQMVGGSQVVRDISESKRSQEALTCLNAQLEALVQQRTTSLNNTVHDFRNIVDALPSIIGYWDRNLLNRVANRAYGEYVGVAPADMLGKSMQSLLGEAVTAVNMPFIDAALRGETQVVERTIAASGDSAERHLLAYYLPDVIDGEVAGFYLLAHDLTELNASRTRLALAERNAAALLQTIHQQAIVSVADRAGNIIEVNDSFCTISGFSREELLGENHRLINSGYHTEAFWSAMWAALSSGQSWRGEVCNKARDGSVYWVDSVISPVIDQEGEVEKFISIRTDITERKRLEADVDAAHLRLEERERFLRNLTDHLPVRMAYLDREGRHRFVNQTYCTYLGLARSAIIGKTRGDLVDSFGHVDSIPLYDAVLKGEAQHLEIEDCVQGKRVWMDAHLVPDMTDSGTVKGIYMVGLDITHRRVAEAELRKTMALLNAVMAAASQVSIIATKPDGLITVFNKGAENLLGYAASEVVGTLSGLDFHEPGELNKRAVELSSLMGREIGAEEVLIDLAVLGEAQEWTYLRKDGAPVPVSLGVTVMRDDQGNLAGYLGIAHDVSLQKELERSLRHAVHKERSANRAKSQFLANMSHEIRTPMNAVIGLSYLLERTALSEEQKGMLGKITVASKSLLALINNILDLSKIEASELKIERVPFSLEHLLSDVRDMVSVQSDVKGIAFKLDMQPQLPMVVEGDSNRLHQVLLNLLTNAVKFTEKGSVVLGVSQLGRVDDLAQIRFEISDSGIGLSSEQLSRLFTPFAQADASTTRRFGGTGLGLSIVKQLVQLMGGKVGVESTPGEGSQFWVEIPMRVCELAVLPTQGLSAAGRSGLGLVGVRVLVADDSEINLEVARRILELEGATVSMAMNGQEVVDLLLSRPDGFDVVLLDLQMPVLDGFDASRRIRSGLGLVALPLIALSASSLSSDIEQAKSAGVNEFVSKPFEPAELVAVIRRSLQRPEVSSPALPPEVQPNDLVLEGWPEIDGVDIAQAHRRLGGDRSLFFSMLKRLVEEFGTLGRNPPSPALAELAELAAHLHKLKGSAGTLGAQRLQWSAGQGETACRDEALDQVQVLLGEISDEMGTLMKAAVPVLEAQGALDLASALQEKDVVGHAVSGEALASLIVALQRNDLAALDQATEMSTGLMRAMGAKDYLAWKERVDSLDFATAASQLLSLQTG